MEDKSPADIARDWRSGYRFEQSRFQRWMYIGAGCVLVAPVAGYGLSRIAPDWSFLAFLPLVAFFIALANALKWLVRMSRAQARVARSSQRHRATPIRFLNEHPLLSAAIVVAAVLAGVITLRHQ